MLIGAISAIGILRKPHACNDKTAVDRQEFEAASKLLNREDFINRDRLIDNELDILHEKGFVDNAYKSLKTFFYAVVIPIIIECPVCTGGDIFRYDNSYN